MKAMLLSPSLALNISNSFVLPKVEYKTIQNIASQKEAKLFLVFSALLQTYKNILGTN